MEEKLKKPVHVKKKIVKTEKEAQGHYNRES